jgi:subtilisin family serine protease
MHLSQLRPVLALTLLSMTLGVPSALGSSPSAKADLIASPQGKAIPNRYIVVLKNGGDPRSVAAVAGVKPAFVYTAALNGFAAELNAGQLTALQHNPQVDYIEQDNEVTLDATQLMDANGDPWGIDRVDQRSLPLSLSYSYTKTGAGVTAFIIDSGLQSNHPEFGGRARNVYDVYGSTGDDCNGHGTHVAGTIGGATYGLAKQTLLHGVRVVDCAGSGSTSNIIAGVDWVRLYGQRPAVANMSLRTSLSTALNTAVANLANSGVFVAVAAGNDFGSACSVSPASAPEAYTVGASDKTDTRANFSNTGSCVDIYAPGVNIKSAWLSSGTRTIGGTSMAAPHVAGAAAIYKSIYGDVPSVTIANWLSAQATPNVIQNNPLDTVNRLLFTGGLSTPNLYGIKKQGTGTRRTEVHILNSANNFQSFLLNTGTALGETGSDLRWDFLLGDYNGDSVKDLYGINKQGSSGRTEVHILNGANNFQSFLLQTATPQGVTGTDGQWLFALGDYNRDGVQDLYGIKKQGTGTGRTEVHILNGANNFQSFLLQTGTALGETGSDLRWDFLLGDYNRDGVQDLYGINKQGSSGRTEVHILNGANNFQSFLLQIATAQGLSGSDGQWLFVLGEYNGDGVQDLYGIKKQNTGTGRTEVHILNGANNFQSFLLQTGTAQGQSGADFSWDFVQ